MNNETRDERLSRLLREADPAASDPGLTLDEVREMRRTVLSAIPERRRRLFPVFATAGGVLVAALILIAVVLVPRPEKPSAPPQIAVVPPKAVPAPQEEPRVTEEKVEEEKKAPVRRKRRAPRPPVVQPAPVEPEATAVIASAEPQQIQFSTPGGTRIIWLLSPGDVSIQGE